MRAVHVRLLIGDSPFGAFQGGRFRIPKDECGFNEKVPCYEKVCALTFLR
jgi:hypothetical protein